MMMMIIDYIDRYGYLSVQMNLLIWSTEKEHRLTTPSITIDSETNIESDGKQPSCLTWS